MTASDEPSPTAARERHLASHIFNITVLLIGGSVCAWMIHSLGPTNAYLVVADVGGWFAVIIALDLGALACDAGAIHQFMRPEARMVKYWRVVCAQASGRAINVLTPGGTLGEATKVTMLVSHVPRARVVSSIVLYNLASFYVQVAIVIVGVPLTALLVDLPHHLQVVVWIGLGVLALIVIAIVVIIQRGALATLLAGARRLRMLSSERAARWTERLLDIDRHIRDVQSDRTPGTRHGLALVCVSKLCSWLATALVLYSVGVELGFTLLLGAFSVGVLIGWMSNLVPFGLGIADTGNYALFNVLGATGADGVFVTLLGRARNLASALLGLAVMAGAHAASRFELARRNRLMARLAAENDAELPTRTG